MSTKGSLGARLLVSATAVLALTACSSGDGDAPGEAASPAPSNPSSSPSTSPSEVQTSPSSSGSATAAPTDQPGVAPATGPLVAVGTVSFRAPDGWVAERGISKDQRSARRPGGGGIIVVNDLESLGSDASALAQIAVESGPKGADRLPDTTLGDDGTVAAQVTWRENGNTTFLFIAVRAGRTINLDFNLRPSDLKADPDLVESVLASWQWIDGATS